MEARASQGDTVPSLLQDEWAAFLVPRGLALALALD